MHKPMESGIPEASSPGATMMALGRRYVGGRKGWIALSVAILVAAGILNWGWLVAVGVAPVLLAFAPCAAMCALGLCMNRAGGASCHAKRDGNPGDRQ